MPQNKGTAGTLGNCTRAALLQVCSAEYPLRVYVTTRGTLGLTWNRELRVQKATAHCTRAQPSDAVCWASAGTHKRCFLLKVPVSCLCARVLQQSLRASRWLLSFWLASCLSTIISGNLRSQAGSCGACHLVIKMVHSVESPQCAGAVRGLANFHSTPTRRGSACHPRGTESRKEPQGEVAASGPQWRVV